jgi:hypothetical protein
VLAETLRRGPHLAASPDDEIRFAPADGPQCYSCCMFGLLLLSCRDEV